MNKFKGYMIALAAASLSTPVLAESALSISGVVEVEASSGEDYAGDKTSDIVLATVEMAVDAEINERVSAHVAFLYEEDETDFGLDEGTLSLNLSGTSYLTAGRMYVPFGNFDSYMISDPLTLELGETSETVLLYGMESGNFSGSLYTFNGDTDESSATDNDQLSFGANAAYSIGEIWFGGSYISNIADSDAIQDLSVPSTVDSPVAGMGVNFGMNINSFTILAEYVAAMDSFANGDLGGSVANEEKPTASNVELAFNLNSGTTVAFAYQMTDEAAFLGLPETATSVAFSFAAMEGANVGLEYINRQDYDVADGGTGESDNAVTLQLAVEF